MQVERVIRARGGFQRRRDLLALGYRDRDLRAGLARGAIFRVRHGWYSVPTAPDAAVSAIRVGGRLTGIAALETYGLRVPRRATIDIQVPRGACRLRKPTDRRARLASDDGVVIHWTDQARSRIAPSSWRVALDDALVFILASEGRDIAVACCSAVARYKGWSEKRMDAVFARAPARVRAWRPLVCALDDSHGETFVRLWVGDAGIPWASQPFVERVGWLDGKVSPHVFIEVDGGQHDPGWTGGTPSTWEHDHDRDTTVVIDGGHVLRYTYRQLYTDWPRVLAAISRARTDDLELCARRLWHPSRPRALSRKRRRSPPDGAPTAVQTPEEREFLQFR